MSPTGAGNGLGETGIGVRAGPNIVLSLGTGSGVVGDGGTLGLAAGDGHKAAEAAEEAGSRKPPSPSELFDSSNGSKTVGSDGGGDCKSGSYSWVVSRTLMIDPYLLLSC